MANTAWGVYIRVSTEDLQRPELSIPAQRAAITERLIEPSGVAVYREYTDLASGKRSDRADYQRMFEDAKAGQFDRLAIHKWDRFGRDLLEALQAEKRLREWGVEIHAANLQVDTTTYTGWLSKTFQQVLAEAYVRNLSEEVIKGKIAALSSGDWPALAPVGYKNMRAQEGRSRRTWVEVDEETAPLVQRIFSMYASGDWSTTRIAEQLNREGIPSPRGKDWTVPTLVRMLRNPFYIGRCVSEKHDIDVPGNWPAIIDEATFQRVGRRLDDRPFRRSTLTYPLSGILYMNGERMTGEIMRWTSKNSKGECIYYADRSTGRYLRYQEAMLEGQIRPYLESLKIAPARIPELREEYAQFVADAGHMDKRARLEREIEQREQESKRLIRLYTKTMISEQEFAVQREQLHSEIAEYRRQLAQLPDGNQMMAQFDELIRLLVRLPEAWDVAKREERAKIARSIFARIDVESLDNRKYVKARREARIVRVEYNPPFEQLRGVI